MPEAREAVCSQADVMAVMQPQITWSNLKHKYYYRQKAKSGNIFVRALEQTQKSGYIQKATEPPHMPSTAENTGTSKNDAEEKRVISYHKNHTGGKGKTQRMSHAKLNTCTSTSSTAHEGA